MIPRQQVLMASLKEMRIMRDETRVQVKLPRIWNVTQGVPELNSRIAELLVKKFVIQLTNAKN